jgi:hypothetical protein
VVHNQAPLCVFVAACQTRRDLGKHETVIPLTRFSAELSNNLIPSIGVKAVGCRYLLNPRFTTQSQHSQSVTLPIFHRICHLLCNHAIPPVGILHAALIRNP